MLGLLLSPRGPLGTSDEHLEPMALLPLGIDIVGPFPKAPGKVKFLVVVVDYFTKWIEVEPLVSISYRQMIKFFMEKHHGKIWNTQGTGQ